MKFRNILIMSLLCTFCTVSSVNADFTLDWDGEGNFTVTGNNAGSNTPVTVEVTDTNDNILYLDQQVSDGSGYVFKTKISGVDNVNVSIGNSAFASSPVLGTSYADIETVCVSSNGADSNDGSLADPVATIAKAIELSSANGLIKILDTASAETISSDKHTVITGNIDVSSSSSFTAAGNITFDGVSFTTAANMNFYINGCTINKNSSMTNMVNVYDVAAGNNSCLYGGKYNEINADHSAIYLGRGISSLTSIRTGTDGAVIFADGADYPAAMLYGTGYVIKSSGRGNVSFSGGNIGLTPSFSGMVSVDGGSYERSYSQTLSRGFHSVKFRNDIELGSVGMKEKNDKYVLSADYEKYVSGTDKIIAAVYDSQNKLKEASSSEITAAGKLTEEFTFNKPEEDNMRMKLFLWENDTLRPLASVYVSGINNLITISNEIYVSPDGNDSGDGSIGSPLKTLAAAQTKARTLANTTVYLRGGEYDLTSPLIFTGDDNNTKYKAYGSETPTITTRKKIDASRFSAAGTAIQNRIIDTAAKSKVMAATLSDEEAAELGKLNVYDHLYNADVLDPTLTYNNERMSLSRYPDSGYLSISSVTDAGNGTTPFTVKVDDISSRSALWSAADNIWACGYMAVNWADDAYDVSVSGTTVTSKTGYKLSAPVAGRRIYFANMLEEIDKPGEWCVNDNVLYFYPPTDITASSDIEYNAQSSTLTSALVIADGATNITVDALKFSGISGNAININDASEININGCDFSDCLGNVIEAQKASGCIISGNTFHDSALGAVDISGGDSASLSLSHNEIKNNTITKVQQGHKAASSAVAARGVGNNVLHNKIYDIPYIAVFFRDQLNTVEYNEISDVCNDVCDSGAIYSGRSYIWRGNKVRYNYIHDITNNYSDGNNVNGVYLDDMLAGNEVYGNTFKNVSCAILAGGGRDNKIEHNVMIDCTSEIYFDERGLSWATDDIQQAGLAGYIKGAAWQNAFPSLYSMLKNEATTDYKIPKNNIVRENISCNGGKINIASNVSTYGTIENNITVSNDVFADYANNDFTIKADSTVFSKFVDFPLVRFRETGIE